MRRVAPRRASSRSLLAASLMFDGLSSRERINDSAPGLTQTVALTTVPAAKCWSPESQSTKPKKPLGFARLSRDMKHPRLRAVAGGRYVIEVTAAATYTIDLTEEQLALLWMEFGGTIDTHGLMRLLAILIQERGFPAVVDVFTDSLGVVPLEMVGAEYDDFNYEWRVEACQ